MSKVKNQLQRVNRLLGPDEHIRITRDEQIRHQYGEYHVIEVESGSVIRYVDDLDGFEAELRQVEESV